MITTATKIIAESYRNKSFAGVHHRRCLEKDELNFRVRRPSVRTLHTIQAFVPL
jgi:hypothetical protein